jgi:iron complex outermembrane receptor protein
MEFNIGGLYAKVEHDLTANGRLLAGLRGDYAHVTHHATGRSDDNLLASGFIRYEHEFHLGLPVTTYAGFGHTERTADWWERYYTFDLAPEKVNQVDVGAIVHGGTKWRGSLGAFYAAYDDYILRDTTSGTTRYRNIDARITGFELDATYAFTSSLKLNGSLVYAYGDNQTDDLPLAQMPPLEFRANLQYDDGTYVAGVLMRAAAAQDRVAIGQGNIIGTDTGATDGFVTFALNAGWRPRPDLLLLAGVDNLLNAEYTEHVNKGVDPTLSLIGYDTTSLKVNEPGRTFWVRAKVTF